MADQLKEIATATITPEDLTGNQFSGTITSTDANTQLRIVEIVGDNGFGADCNLEVNNFKAAEITSPPSGTAIVDVNSTVRAAFAEPLQFVSSYLNANVSSGNFIIKINYTVNGASVNRSDEIIIPGISTNFGGLASIASDGDRFAYAQGGDPASGNSNLQKNTSGGTVTTVPTISGTCDIAFDGVRYYYTVINSTQIRRFDIETETLTTINVTGASLGGIGTQNRLVFTNGVLVWVSNGGGASFQAIDLVTNRCVSISHSGFYNENSTVAVVSFYYDRQSGTLVGLSTQPSAGAIRFATVRNLFFEVGATTSSASVLNYFTNNFTPNLILNNGHAFLMTSLNTFYGLRSNGLSEYVIGVPAALGDAPVGYTNQTQRMMLAVSNEQSPSNTDFPVALKLRLAGIETTA